MKEDSHKIFIKDGEVIASGVESTVTEGNIVSSITVDGIDHDESKEVSKSELKEINEALHDDKKKVMIENGKPRIRLLDDKGKIK